jgi:hypothetical protein
MLNESAAATIILLLLGTAAHPAERPARDMHQHQRHANTTAPHWYDEDCCNLDDCRKAPTKAIEQVAEGYLVYGEHVIKHGDERIRPSRDADFHICEMTSEWGHKFIRCIYVPLST